MEKGFLSPNEKGIGKVINRTNEVANSYVVTSLIMDQHVVASRNNKGTEDGNVGQGVTPTTTTARNTSFVPITFLESFPTLTTPVTSTAGSAPGKSSYVNITGKPSAKKVNVRTLFTPRGIGIDVGKYGLVRSMFSSFTGLFSFKFSSIDGLDVMLENGPWFIWNYPLILKKWHPDENLLKEDVSTVPVSDVELKDNIVVAMPKITMDGHYICNVRVEYEWKPPRCSSCKFFGHIHEECPKNTGASEKKNVKKPSQTSRGTTNLVNNEATSSGSSFMNIDNDGEFASNTPIGKKIDKIERQICEGKLRLLDMMGKLLVPSDGSDKGCGTNTLLEQWMDSYPDNNDYDLYNDDMYENHDLSEHLQSICVDLDITVHGKKKK
ncbi:nucleotide-diphospho-sugar transferase [Tanacetum coccineum]